jgi:lantibiotic modifying enzyme
VRAAEEAFAYERGIFSAEARNWPDLREQGGEGARPFLTMWCHGAPGAGLARLLSLRHADSPELRQEAADAIATTLEQGFGKNHSLCHGDLGNLDVLRQAARITNDAALDARSDALASSVLESISTQGWLCGVPLGVESPGLMTGLAGVGYGLLRLAEPDGVPSVLSLDLPKESEQ